ncbi:MAG: hypothetical protein AAB568_00030 [Patescibacteria group bacterium]
MATYCSFCLKDFAKRDKVRAVYRSDSIPETNQLICSRCVAKIRHLVKKLHCPQRAKCLKREPHLLFVATALVDGWLEPTNLADLIFPISCLKLARKSSRALREMIATFIYDDV